MLEPSFPPLPSSPSKDDLLSLPARLRPLTSLGRNDIYAWFLSAIAPAQPPSAADSSLPAKDTNATSPAPVSTLRLSLIHPASEQHLRKYAPQRFRVVRETADIYRSHTRPFIRARTWGGAGEKGVRWVGNILDGVSETESVLHRHVDETHGGDAAERKMGKGGWVLLPDMNWDRRDKEALRLLCLVERRDVASLRDLKKRDVGWLRKVIDTIEEVVERDFGVERDRLRFYVHCGYPFVETLVEVMLTDVDHPTYYHFHIHISHAALAPGPTLALGRAFSLPNLLAQLESMAGDDSVGLDGVEIEYTVGDESELWKEVWAPIKGQGKG